MPRLPRRDVLQAALGLALAALTCGGAPARSKEKEGPGGMSKDIVLLHGANEGAWVFDTFRQTFEKLGFDCHGPDLIGHGVNAVTGDYSVGASGFLIDNGEIATPVAEITIAGNLVGMYRSLTAANDLEHRRTINVPTLRIEGMTVAGA